ncbi:hypothetical protein [Herbidospora sp. NBRC 101105]|uniref:hypothetical protein n=1 Tax=Herbidospora sp. NBRC 101105 TaxID=3032195 RepID=UPI0024A2F42A|nr:hypothetical protein [Herbidospora sp. NBRC 101105]GLX94376.1 hypothetical protein Hesp01_23260 [Herbidospora sp. NBRC 101105]
MRSTALLGLVLALTACGTATGEAPGGRPHDQVNAAACLEFALAADDLRAAARVTSGELRAALTPALRHMDRAVQAANGDVAPVMDDAVLAAEAGDTTALAAALVAVEGACRRAGTPIEVPFRY